MIVTADVILGFEVLWPGELVLILVSGLEFYAFKNEKWERLKKIDITIHWYAIKENIVIVSSSQSQIFPVYRLKQGHNATRLDSLNLDVQMSAMDLIHKRNFVIFFV
jgi:hypothetical protein